MRSDEVTGDIDGYPALAGSAVVVVDMQNDFCAPGGTADRRDEDLARYPAVIAAIRRLVTACRALEVPVLHVQMLALPKARTDSAAWARMRRRSYGVSGRGFHDEPADVVQGSWGSRFVQDLQPVEAEPVITKFRSSSFFGTSLELLLRSLAIESLIVTGCTTEGCVESTVRDASFRDFGVYVPVDCVGSNRLDLHEASLTVMGAYRAELLRSDDLLASWRAY